MDNNEVFRNYRYKNKIKYYGIIALEVFEMIASLVLSRRMPNVFGTVAVILSVFVTITLNTDSTRDNVMQRHRKLFSTLFLIAIIVSILALILILISNRPTGVINRISM